MARGWESKSVESQIESARSNRSSPSRQRLTPEMAAAVRKKESLLLARTHLQQQIQASQNPRHRALLADALADVEKQLAATNASNLSLARH
jgi:hypothetical protein